MIRILTKQDMIFIDENYKSKSDREIGELLGLASGTIASYRRRMNLRVCKEESNRRRIKMMTGKTSSTPEIDEILTTCYLTVNVKQLSLKIGRSETFVKIRLRQLNLVIPQEIIEQRKKENRIKKGNTPPNKGKKQVEYMTAEAIEKTKHTRFKKGNLPHNTRACDGTVSLRPDKRGVKQYFIRTALNKWVYLSRYLWSIHRGEIPPKHIVIFKDGNSLHCHIDNLHALRWLKMQ